MRLLAQQRIDLGNTIGGAGLGALSNRNWGTSGQEALQAITDIVSAVIGFMTVAAGIWLMFQILIAGINWISSGGDKTKIENARDRLTNAMIGIVIVAAGWAILALAGKFLDWDILITSPGTILNQINLNP